MLACAVRLLDRGFFRIGSEGYAEENQTYGIATMRRRHVDVTGDTVTFDYEAKGGKRRVQTLVDPGLAKLIRALDSREGGGRELLAFKSKGEWRDVRSDDINAYVRGQRRRVLGQGLPHLERHGARGGRPGRLRARARRRHEGRPNRAKNLAIKQVARFLGNTPAVCRASYIDPRVLDRFDGGLSIGGVFDRLPDDPSEWPEVQGPIENAVLDLLERRESSAALERV